MKIKKGDTVRILVGKDAGREGRVLKVIPEASTVVVDGMNVYKKHMKGDGQKKQSAIIDIAKPMSLSNVMLICPSCRKPSRVGYKITKGKKDRVCKKCGAVIDTVKEEKKEAKPKKDAKKKAPTKKKTAKGSKADKTKKESKKK